MRSFVVIPTLITLAAAAPVLRRADATDSAAAAASTDASSGSSGIVGGLESAAVGALKSLLESKFPELAGVLDALNIRELAARAADDATATDSAASAAATDAAAAAGGDSATSAIIKDVVDAIKTFVESKDPALAGILDALPIRRADDAEAVDDAGDVAATDSASDDDAAATDSASDASATDSAAAAEATDAAASSSSSVNPIVKDIVDALKSAIEAKVPALSGILDKLPIRRAEAVDDAGDVAATDSASDATATDSAAAAESTDAAASSSSSVNPIVKDVVDALKSLIESKVPELSGILDALPIKKRDTAATVKTILDAIKPLIEAKFPEIAGLLDALPVKRADDATSTDAAAAATSTAAAASSAVDPKVKIIGDVVDAVKSLLEAKFPQIKNIVDPILGRSLNDLD